MNKGTIDATGTNNQLAIAAGNNVINTGLNGSSVEFDNATVRGGTTKALNGSQVYLNGATIAGGTLATAGSGQILAVGVL